MSTESHLPDPDASDARAHHGGAEDATQEEMFSDEDGVLYDDEVAPEYGFLGFTLRELLIVGVWVVVFVTSFFPLYAAPGPSIWQSGIDWILPIGVPTVAVFLIALRRFSPDGIRRVGSLGIDQFASVAFSVAAVIWAQTTVVLIANWIGTGQVLPGWVSWVQLIGALALVALTVFAPLIPRLREDFHGRLVTLAHRNANPVRPVITKPRETPADAPQAQASPLLDEEASVLDEETPEQSMTDKIAHLGFGDSVPVTSHASGGDLGTQAGFGGSPDEDEETDYAPAYARTSRGQFDADLPHDADASDDIEDIDERVSGDVTPAENSAPAAEGSVSAPASSQPFWALAPTERDVLDERGAPLFRIGPTAWALVIEDRGGAYVIRHDDGRIGYLHDIADITRG